MSKRTLCPTPEKIAHRSLGAALKARESLEVESGIDLSLRPYRCECGAWHLGHRAKRGFKSWRTR